MAVTRSDLQPNRGAVALLVEKYIQLRGTTKTRVAISLGVDPSKVRWLVNGRADRSVRYLGLRTIGDAAEPFLRRLADQLQIPDAELIEAVASDLGIIRAVSPTVHPSEFSPAFADNVVSLDAARHDRRDPLRLIPRRAVAR